MRFSESVKMAINLLLLVIEGKLVGGTRVKLDRVLTNWQELPELPQPHFWGGDPELVGLEHLPFFDTIEPGKIRRVEIGRGDGWWNEKLEREVKFFLNPRNGKKVLIARVDLAGFTHHWKFRKVEGCPPDNKLHHGGYWTFAGIGYFLELFEEEPITCEFELKPSKWFEARFASNTTLEVGDQKLYSLKAVKEVANG